MRLALLLLLCSLQGCAISNHRDGSFEQVIAPPGVMLLIVGGNSEYAGDKGLWRIRKQVAEDLARALGLQRQEVSTDYVSWSGDAGESPGMFPQNKDSLNGHLLISERLANHQRAGRFSLLIIVGWSNGGATAAQLSAYLTGQHTPMPVDLLVTLDPVSTFTPRPAHSGAEVWLNVYTRSTMWDRLTDSGNWIAALGGAWNQFSEGAGVPALQQCIVGNHGEAERMWEAVIVPSPAFAAWAASARARLKTEGRQGVWPQPASKLVFERCG